jgi:hypothetical protein
VIDPAEGSQFSGCVGKTVTFAWFGAEIALRTGARIEDFKTVNHLRTRVYWVAGQFLSMA